jgi:hypothetical protein
MVLFGNNYDTSLGPERQKLNLTVDPYMSQQMPFEHGIQPIAPSPYGGGPSEDAQTIGAVGDAVSGVANAYGQKKKMDAEKAYQDKLLAALGIGGGPAATSSPSVSPAPASSMGIAEQDPELARALQAQSHQRYMNTMRDGTGPTVGDGYGYSYTFPNQQAYDQWSAKPPTLSTGEVVGVPQTAPTTPTTPTGASTFQLNGSPIPPTTPAPTTPASPSTGGTQASLAGAGGALSQTGLIPGGVLTNPNMSKTTLASNLLGTPDPSGASGLSGTYSGGSFAVSPLVTNYIASLIGTK